MTLQQLRTFLAVAEHRSIRAAARALFISQPAVTRAMRELERDLDILLLRRSVEGIELTEAGQALQARARLLLEDIRRTREELAYMKDGGHGQVAAAVTSTVGFTLLPQALDAFTRRMPQARIALAEDAPPVALEKLRSGALDLVVTNTPDGDLPEDVVQQPLFLMHLRVAARRVHPMVKATSLRVLQDQHWVMPSLNQRYFAQLFASKGLQVPAAVLGCESFGIAWHLAMHMDLLLLVSSPVYEAELRPRGLRALPLRDKLPKIGVSIVTLRGARLTPAARAFVECLCAVPLPAGLERAG